jgi:eukaryotic-like serine/threonine-protein kinase
MNKCEYCHSPLESESWSYCPSCGTRLDLKNTLLFKRAKEEPLSQLHQYSILKEIAQGGMGHVFLAYDPVCDRTVALKKMNPEFIEDEILKKRFIREARVCCHMAHPSIIPVFNINISSNSAFYTMPFIEGATMRAFLKKTIIEEKEKKQTSLLPYLLRTFVQICQGISYSHSLGILHSDLKPENIMLGKFGDVYILDWGLAQINSKATLSEEMIDSLLPPGKLIGTAAYMSPERAFGEPASVQSEVYALGVILYQLLTYKMPFRRKSIKEFRKNAHNETLTVPELAAPYREIPQQLSLICQRCLAMEPKERYSSVNQLLDELHSYMEGSSEWLQVGVLNTKQSEDWEFQESIILNTQFALRQITEGSDWVNLMISKSQFSGNIKLETSLILEEGCEGVGFLVSVPEPQERSNPSNGYCLWISPQKEVPITLFLSGISVATFPSHSIKSGERIHLCIEHIDNNLHFYLNDLCVLHYICPIPLSGTHIGFMTKDNLFSLTDLVIFEGSLHLTLGCLALPDSFFTNKLYDKSLGGYRQIYRSFPDRKEGIEALFRAGLSLLKRGKSQKKEKLQEDDLEEAWLEFEKLSSIQRSAPLEYLGKALIYKNIRNSEEEVKCLEYGMRRYIDHPKTQLLKDHAHYRLHQSAQKDRIATYRFALLINRITPEVDDNAFLKEISRYWKNPYFFKNSLENKTERFSSICTLLLSFWLNQPALIENCLEKLSSDPKATQEEIFDALFSLLELNAHSSCLEFTKQWSETFPSLAFFSELLKGKFEKGMPESAYRYLVTSWVDTKQWKKIDLNRCLEEEKIWIYLSQGKLEEAEEFFKQVSNEVIYRQDSLLFFLYGCWLFSVGDHEGGEVHFSEILKTSTPPSELLFTNYLHCTENKHSEFIDKLFYWEKKQLYRQGILYFQCKREKENEDIFIINLKNLDL